ncbi:thiamine pyrophosphate-dependent enzyme [Limobrevibacterium gyesilva]|uniref:Thiamine pyrophosphate-binding protein n=1 Tax=Limobrevibacterium gyesilva TaxID=2991712 RepID=A0AA41YIY7_9PROT|nr:thiamine pyrophosphate-dependent enzyme [Limobrevibacterium gyesilva]MCW3474494.1 thiamine pyrophosphate-binding protein [Limobrevibacterium gyesilva]
MTRKTTAEATVDSLVQHGIDTLYALPGVHNDHLFDAVHQSGGRMRVLHPRHEQTAGYMALGAALATGRPQACAMVPGPGVLNAAAALLTAFGTGAPVIALAGQIPSDAIDRGWGHLHELHDQLGLLGHFTKYAARIGAAAEAPGLVAEAVRQATSGRTRPVALECAIDTWGREGAVPDVAPLPVQRPPVDEAAIAQAAKLLGAAQRPIIIAGGGALDAGPELLAVAELLQAPVLTYRRGRGVIPTTHPLAVSLPVGHRLWQDADAVLAVGTRLHFAQSNWGTDPALKIVRLDIDPEEQVRLRRPDCAILADAADGLRALAAALPGHNPPRGRREDVAAHQAWFAERLARQEPQMGYLRAIRAALPADGVVVEDVTQVGFVGRLAFPVDAPRRYISPGYQDNLGWGYGTALGVQAALPDRAVVAICGDGGFMYQAAELATAMRHTLPVVAIVFDDGTFGNVKRIQEQQFGNRLIAHDLANPDFFQFARSFGMAAFRARTEDELRGTLTEALAARAPALIHVKVGDMPSPWDMLALPRVRGFEEAWRPALP